MAIKYSAIALEERERERDGHGRRNGQKMWKVRQKKERKRQREGKQPSLEQLKNVEKCGWQTMTRTQTARKMKGRPIETRSFTCTEKRRKRGRQALDKKKGRKKS